MALISAPLVLQELLADVWGLFTQVVDQHTTRFASWVSVQLCSPAAVSRHFSPVQTDRLQRKLSTTNVPDEKKKKKSTVDSEAGVTLMTN